MRKIIVAVLFLGTLGLANAQDLTSKKGENYLPEAGDWAIGFNADGIFRYIGNSFNGNLNNGGPSLGYLNEGTFVGKKFIDEKSAYRIIVNFEYSSLTQSEPDFADDDPVILEQTTKNFNLALGVGKEWRRGKTRLQGFYGVDAMIRMNAGSLRISAQNEEVAELKNKLAYGASIRGFIGAEYFIFPKMAIGAQYTYGVNAAFGGGQSIEIEDDSLETDDGSAINIGGVGISSINLTLHF